MVTLTIDNRTAVVEETATILEAAQQVGIHIPTLCYLKDINDVASCRICAVEVEGVNKLATACNTLAEDGMVIHTNTERVRLTRKTNVELILSQHVDHCVTCVRSGNCSLQKLSKDMNIQAVPFGHDGAKQKWDSRLPILRDSSKCIKCLRCVSVCEKVQSLRVWEMTGSGAHAAVRVRGGKPLDQVNCSYCGQCVAHCPVGALKERDDTEKVFAALNDPTKEVVFQIAPAVRSAWGDDLGIPPEQATEKRLVAAVKALGAKHVFDTTFSADLTILEESSELLARLAQPEPPKFPLFTSCCPGWVRFVKLEYPQMAAQLSTAKSPQQMFGAVAKSYYAKQLGKDASDIFCVSVMPCTAKKYECDVPEVSDSGAKDVDVVLTTRELDRMLRAMQIHASALDEAEFDRPLGEGSGAGVIFGATGGVMEAALRTAYFQLTGTNAPADAFGTVRGRDGWREASFEVQGRTLRLAVVHGLANAGKLLDAIKTGQVSYDFVEVMACPGGCSGGGGQPIQDGVDLSWVRGARLYQLDETNPLRFSHENPAIKQLYQDYLNAPLSEQAHKLLHTDQSSWTL